MKKRISKIDHTVAIRRFNVGENHKIDIPKIVIKNYMFPFSWTFLLNSNLKNNFEKIKD